MRFVLELFILNLRENLGSRVDHSWAIHKSFLELLGLCGDNQERLAHGPMTEDKSRKDGLPTLM